MDATDPSVVTNPYPAGQIIYQNDSLIYGCVGINVWAQDVSAGNEIGPYVCPNADVNGKFDWTPNYVQLLSGTLFPGAIVVSAKAAGGVPSTFCMTVDQAIPSTFANGTASLPYILDDGDTDKTAGVQWDGLGAIFGDGASRLLYDYPQQQRDEILQYLFKPGAGASLSILKLEIGGDGQTIMGSTPSHQHSPTDTPTLRGVQGWLAQQARKLNPSIKLYALPWSFPGWLRQGTSKSPFIDPAAAASYVVTWLQLMVSTYATQVDIIGIYSDNWDDSSPPYVKALRAALNNAGMTQVKIECADSLSNWPCAAAAMADSDLAAIVDIYGAHSGVNAQAASVALRDARPLWQTHFAIGNTRGMDMIGAHSVATQINNGYLASVKSQKVGFSGMILWGGLCSTVDGQPEFNQGLIRAVSPWSGAYYVTPALWVVAHTSSFAKPGWSFLNPTAEGNEIDRRGSGTLNNGGTYVTRVAPDGSGWSTVIAKFVGSVDDQGTGVTPEYATFVLGGKLQAATTAGVYVYATNLGSTAAGNATIFVQDPSNNPGGSPIVVGVDGSFTVFLAPHTLYTLTNNPAAYNPLSAPASPMPTAFPISYQESAFRVGAAVTTPLYLVEINGAFESVTGTFGTGVQQTAASVPLTRFQTETRPHAILGNEQWTDVDWSATVVLPSVTDTVRNVAASEAKASADFACLPPFLRRP